MTPIPARPPEAPAPQSPDSGEVLLRGEGAGAWSRHFRDPVAVLTAKDGAVTLRWRDGRLETRHADPFHTLRDLLAAHPALTAAGYWSYDLRYGLERLPRIAADDLALPDCWLGLYESHHAAPAPAILPDAAPRVPPPDLSANRRRYEQGVARILEYIAAGDCYQANLAHRISVPFAGDPRALFGRLSAVSPAPFAACLHCGDHHVVSSSPELFLRVRDGWAETRPIKGTRPRSPDPVQDARVAAELLASEKDRAELLMIVDLERNDLGRVCEYGSVHVPQLFGLESYAQVHHLVASVRGRLRRDVTPLDCLRAAFPGGSITGAPKIRAMEIIEELEPVRRGVYTGAIGWVDGRGNAEWSIAIRTMVVAAGRAHFHVGAGIVADSTPAGEWRETLAKAAGMLAAIGAGA